MTLSDAEKLVGIINRADYENAKWFTDWFNLTWPSIVFEIPSQEEWIKGNNAIAVRKFEE